MNNVKKFQFGPLLDEYLQICLKMNIVPFLVGAPGTGKSSALEGVAKHVFTVACNQLAYKDDLAGVRTQHDAATDTWSQVYFPHGQISAAIECAKANPDELVVILLDEINRATSDVTSACLSFITARLIGTVKLPENIRFVAAGNDEGNVTAIDSASCTRFAIIHIAPSVSRFLEVNPDLNPIIADVLQKYPEEIMCTGTLQEDDDDIEDDAMDIETNTAPRTITMLSNWLNEASDSYIANLNRVGLLGEAISAIVGHTSFAGHVTEAICERAVATVAKKITITKPANYDNLLSITTRSKLEAECKSMDQQDISDCLLYALCDSEDRSVIIKALASQALQFPFDKLVACIKSGTTNENNTQVLRESGTPVGDAWSNLSDQALAS